MDSTNNLRPRKRGLVFLVISAVMLILGETVLKHSLGKMGFLIYWTVCFIVTFLAIVFAFLDVAGVQRRAREQQRELLEKTIEEIAKQKEEKAARDGGKE